MGKPAKDPLDHLSEAWRVLRLSVRCPARVPTWDAVVLTAASPAQAELYQRHLEQAQVNGTIAKETAVLAVPDPEGKRIGSGAATVHALRALAHHFKDLKEEEENCSSSPQGLAAMVPGFRCVDRKRVLLLHTGGDSKRVPWANPIGKAFIPLPFLAGDEPDGHILTLFDHILAISASVLQSFSSQGGLLIMTGDVLPCFDGSSIAVPENGAVVITVPAALATAGKHGVILASQAHEKTTSDLPLVMDLLQKPSAKEMAARGAVLANGKALLDTGIFVVRGAAFRDLVEFALLDPSPVADVLASGDEVSLYEEIAGSWVSARHEWLASRPLGKRLIKALGSNKLYHHCAEELEFLHFGTSGEVLDHLSSDHRGRILRNQFSAIPSSLLCEISPSASIIGSEVHPHVSVGEASLIFSCTLVEGVRIGSRCVAMGLTSQQPDAKFALPDRHCLWRVPVSIQSQSSQVILCCGLDDDPKVPLASGGTFCGGKWSEFLSDRGIERRDLWDSNVVENLWNAKLFPAVEAQEQGLGFAMWLMGVNFDPNFDASSMVLSWRGGNRLSLSDLHRHINFSELSREIGEHVAGLAGGFLKASIVCGSLGRNFSLLCRSIKLGRKEFVAKTLEEARMLVAEPKGAGAFLVPESRRLQALTDICEALGEARPASEALVWDAVAKETSAAVLKSHAAAEEDATSESSTPKLQNSEASTVKITSRTSLPVRIDIAGGWSDTPPYTLHHPSCVLNLAVQLNHLSPLSATITLTPHTLSTDPRHITHHAHRHHHDHQDHHHRHPPFLTIVTDDDGDGDPSTSVTIQDRRDLSPPFPASDPFRLVKAALIVTGWTGSTSPRGKLEVRTGSGGVPRGSGLGVSSILAAAVVKGLLEAKGVFVGEEEVVRRVLAVEQVMGSGGGWQDQVGGVYGGVKLARGRGFGGFLGLQVERVGVSEGVRNELRERMLLVFTGQVRQAHTVLQRVVRRYLQRDTRLTTSIKRLAALASLGALALAANDLDTVGSVASQAWLLHQELDPDCSNSFVDALFHKVEHLSCGHKLVGAGGGGFAVFIGKSKESTLEMKSLLESVGSPVVVYDWNLFEG